MEQRLHVVVGAQYGSEGKGHVAARLVSNELAITGTEVINIRVAGPNAGHTVCDSQGQRFGLRSVPVGAVVSDDVVCYIAPGSEVDIDVLLAEVNDLRQRGHAVDRLAVSGEATLITSEHRDREREEGLTSRIGSTGVGVGAARADRIMRTAMRVIDSPDVVKRLTDAGISIADPQSVYGFDDLSVDKAFIVEGTQGYGLGTHAGFYPMSTSSNARAIDFLSMADISPWRHGMSVKVWLVARVNPIRVAGNSGWIKDETSWDEIGLEPELTTVTKRVRRVGGWDAELVSKAVQSNGGSAVSLVISMLDHAFPEMYGVDDSTTDFGTLLGAEREQEFHAWIAGIEEESNTRIGMVTTSPTTSFMR